MRKIPCFVTALILPAVPLLIASPGTAGGDNVICVGSPVGACDESAGTIPAALVKANSNLLDDTILIGPGTFSSGPLVLQGTAHALTVKGAGTSTIITVPAGASQTYLTIDHVTLRDLEVKLDATTPDNDIAVSAANNSVIANVTVDGTGAVNARGLQLSHTQVSGATVQMTGANTTAVYGQGGNTISDSTLAGDTAFNYSGLTTDTLSRVTLRVGAVAGVSLDGGSVSIDDSVIDLGSTGGTGVQASNFNNSPTPRVVVADHLTIVGGGASSRGVWAYASSPGAKQTTTVTLTNSIVRGPATSLVADADNDGTHGGDSSATVTVDHSDYQSTGGTIGAHGTGGVTLGGGNVVDVDPAFVDAAARNYHLSLGSPAIDAGNPAAGGSSTDRDGNVRVADGDANGTAVRDLGAYEYADLVAPQTTITGGPATHTPDTTPTVTFTSEPGATFTCQVDAGAYAACTSPFTTSTLAAGTHTVRVRAKDLANNTDATPASRSFTVDTTPPSTSLTKKPAKKFSAKTVTFKFASSETGSTFTCRLDKAAWRSCRSPRVFTVAKGGHVFAVRATDAAGNVDKTPSAFRFRRT